MEQTTFLKNLTEALKDLRQRGVIGKRDVELEKLLGYHKSTLSSYLNGKINISDPFIRKFKKVFNIDITDYKPRALVAESINDHVERVETKSVAYEATLEVILIKVAELIVKTGLAEGRLFSEVYLDLQTEIERVAKRRTQLRNSK